MSKKCMQYDIIIVGGGLVGLSLALALHDTNLRIAVINARLPQHDDPRLFALNYSSCQLFNNLGLWPAFSSKVAPIHKVHVSYRGRFGAVRLHHQDIGLATLGHVIPANEIEIALQNKIAELDKVTLYQPAKVISLNINENTQVLISNAMNENIELQAKLIIGADGNDSTVRRLLNISTHEYNYKQSAIVTRTNLHRVQAQEGTAYERFYTDGAIAMLPLPDNQYATIWTASDTTIAELMSLSDSQFLQTLQKIFGYRLGRFDAISKRYTYPLRMIHAQKMQRDNVFLLGNSAHALHPIAAQGFNLALYEVAMLAEYISEKSTTHISTIDLQQISDLIYKQQRFSMTFSHRLANLQTSSIINNYSQLGMIFLDLVMPIKRYFIKHVLGRSGRVPQLLLRDADTVISN